VETQPWERQANSLLRSKLKNRDLKTTGRKASLVTRLVGDDFLKGIEKTNTLPIIFSYDDRHGWGRLFIESMLDFRGVECRLFSLASEVPDMENVFVYIHPDHLINRAPNRKMIEDLQNHNSSTFMPSKMELMVYDEKVRQTELYSDYIPTTRVFTDLNKAISSISKLDFPLISKSNEGAASSNIRFIESSEDALEEAKIVFSDSGLPRHDSRNMGLVQKDYVLWQDFLPGNDNDWRIVLMNMRYAWVLKRYNRTDLPFASGSGIVEPITEMNSEINEILNYSLAFASRFSLNFTGIDLVRDGNGELKVLETTTGWGKKAFKSTVFELSEDGSWRKTIFRGKDQWHIAALSMADMIEKKTLYDE